MNQISETFGPVRAVLRDGLSSCPSHTDAFTGGSVSADPAVHHPRFTVSCAERARAFHKTIPGYAPTPLVSLTALTKRLDTGAIYVKDESFRFGLNAFKVLGGSYCIGRFLKEYPGTHTFVTATDGNHGRGIAWAAARLGQKSVVYLPAGSAVSRLEAIRALGAEAEITPWNYDDTVRFAAAQAEAHGWSLVQDTCWPGYETIPSWIMGGYTTMGLEITEQLDQIRPTHIFLQAGVGAMAGAMTGFFADYYKETLPRIILVEPEQAACIYATAEADDGTLHTVSGALNTIMAGLACGEPCSLGWDELNAYASAFLSVPDVMAADGMRLLGKPLGGDRRIISGESGAATLGTLAYLLSDPALSSLKEALGLGTDSKILCISTEGDTDPENYRKILSSPSPFFSV